MTDIPAYQSIDVALGKQNNPIQPARGWYVGSPRGTLYMGTNEEDACAIANANGELATKCWIHDEEGRKCHTPR